MTAAVPEMNECIDEHSLVAVVHAVQGFVPAELINCNLSVVYEVLCWKNLP